MSKDYSSLSQLIRPVDVGKFRAAFWEQHPMLVQRKTPGYYAGLLALCDIERLIPLMRLAPDALRIVKNGETLKLSPSLNEVDAIVAAYQQGATVILQALHKYWPPLTDLCNSLATEFSCPFQVNAYLTPPSADDARGLSTHYDVHDVFVLQLSGSKHWRLYDSPVRLPLENDSFHFDGSNYDEPETEFDLNQGDCLYIPRGYVHEALVRANRSASLHLTIGVKCLTWMDLIQAVLHVAGVDEQSLRTSLPIGFARDDNQMTVLMDHFKEMTNLLSAKHYIRRAIDELADDLLHQQRSTLDHRLTDIEQCARIGVTTMVYQKQGVVARLDCREGRVSLAFHGKEVIMPMVVHRALQFILRTRSFYAEQLPDDLDDEGKIVLVQRLVNEGYLTLRKDEEAPAPMMSDKTERTTTLVTA